jgi:hypothetical protein
MKFETRNKLFELYEKKLILLEDYKLFTINPNDKNLKKAVKSQFTYSINDLDIIILTLFRSWKTFNTIFESNEILIINQLLNHCGLLSRKELMCKTNIERRKLSMAIEGLLNENAIKTISLSQNNTLVYINKIYFDKILNNKK